MTAHGQQGRRVHLPEDPTPYSGAYVDVAARIAWLLRVHRLLSPHPETAGLAAFARRLSAAGLRADPARVSRWETSAVAPTAEVITAYEVALELPAGQLLAVCEGLGHSVLSRQRDWLAPAVGNLPGGSSQRRLDQVYDRVLDGVAAGGDWLHFSGLLTGAEPALVPTRVVQELTNQLVDEMSRSVGVAYYTRFEALCRMATAAATAPAVVRAVTAAVHAEGAQSILDAMTLFGEIPHPAVASSLVRTADRDGARLRLGAVHALLNMVLLGTLPQPAQPEVEALAVALLDPKADMPGQRLGQLLAGRLREDARQRVVRRSGVPVSPPVSASRRTHALPPSLERYVEAAELATGIVADPMLARLLREFLAGDFIERQHQAALMLLASPYRNGLAGTALALAAQPNDPEAAAMAVHLLTYLASDVHVPQLRRLFDVVDPQLRGGVLRALTHADADALTVLPGAGAAAEADRGACGPAAGDDVLPWVSQAGVEDTEVLYAAGMTGHPGLASLAGDAGQPHARRVAARWWLQHGPAVRT